MTQFGFMISRNKHRISETQRHLLPGSWNVVKEQQQEVTPEGRVDLHSSPLN